ncbi:MAG: formate dehydrogenase accessory protein FdhE [Desulfovibrio sp.]|jgi:FdhE protein|nr:formate dehydrogenase accessory protein FdhE [Desulfovibrio sp.]
MPASRLNSARTPSRTIDEIITWRPVLKPVLRAFEPLLTARAELTGELEDRIRACGLTLPEIQEDRLRQGVSLFAGLSFDGAAEAVRQSAGKLLPLFEGMRAVAASMPALRGYFLRPPDTDGPDSRESRPALMEAVASDNSGAVARIARDNGLEPLMLEFVSAFVVSAVLRAMVAVALSAKERSPWNEGDIWQQGYCPVCGAMPSAGWLNKPELDEKNAFLAGGGGKKHLYCGRCGADWKFRRSACPACSAEGGGVIEILRESGVSHGERLEWCTQCKAYCPAVDLREREFVPDPDAMAMGMMHLDMVAARKKLRPLMPSFWNMF